MKNSIFFKFIAVLLCAASLVGIVGGVAGIIMLTEYDLYNKSVDQVREERQDEAMRHMAELVAKHYASQTLGGCPEDMTGQQYGSVAGSLHYFWDPDYCAYEITDAEGNVLESFNMEIAETARSTYEYPVTGQYMHLVSTQTESEREAQAQAKAAELYAADAASVEGVFVDLDGEAIPAEGAKVDHATFTDAEGRHIYEVYSDGQSCVVNWNDPESNMVDTHVYGDSSEVGFLFYNQAGRLVFRSLYREYSGCLQSQEVMGVYFYCDDGLVFQYDSQDGAPLGYLSLTENDYVTFVSYYPEAAAEETVEETVPVETVPEVTAVTEPPVVETTAVAETVDVTEAPAEEAGAEAPADTEGAEAAEVTEGAEEAAEETVPSSASAVPEETGAPEATATAVTEAPIEGDTGEAVTEAAAEPTVAQTLPPETVPAETAPEETVPEVTEPVTINGKPLNEYQLNSVEYWDSQVKEHVAAKYVYLTMPEMTVKVYLAEDAYRFETTYELLEMLWQVRNYLLPAIGVCLLIFAIFAVYLCTAAGRKPKSDEVKAGGLNALPLDFYTVNAGAGIWGVIALMGVVFNEGLLNTNFMVGAATVAALAFAGCLLLVGYCFAFVAQCKTPGGYWWRNSLTVRCIMLFVRFAMWLERVLEEKGLPFLGRMIKGLWQMVIKSFIWLYRVTEKAMLWTGDKLGRIFRWTGGKVHRFLCLLPMTWQWLLVGAVMILFSLLIHSYYTFYVLVGIFVPIAIVLYASHCFGSLFEATRRMSKGDLNAKIDDKMMLGCFKDFAADLTDLGDVAVVAAQKQLKSERMKTELITNVSHDIKTPLTSIINYVDLMQKPHTDEEQAQYLEVLDRQSQRLKKLIDDLMDMSKASTGNMAVEITKVDAVESVNQALGEFADKLDRAQLIPVFRHGEDSVAMMADGRLVWRVLSNLLGNAVKYAMPGTRLYVDLAEMEGKVILSLKNISRDELNVDADELMERFVRGDDSRNTEGSGLGLNIAKSLMELQKGQLQLLVDGDLFKVTLIFPGA